MNSRILIIDFDAKTLRAWEELLTGAGYSVGCARTAQDVDAELRATPPRLVILEPMLPGQDGFEICRKVKSPATAPAPAVIIASRIFKGARYRGLARDAGADMFLEKPVKDEMLLSMVGKFASPAPTGGRSAMRTTAPVPVARGGSDGAGASRDVTPFAASHPLAHAPSEKPAAPAAPATTSGLDQVSDDDIDGALDRLTFEGEVGLEMDAASPPATESAPKAASPVGVEVAPPPKPAPPAARSGPDISEDELAAALDRLEMSTGSFPAIGGSDDQGTEEGPEANAALSEIEPVDEIPPVEGVAPLDEIGEDLSVSEIEPVDEIPPAEDVAPLDEIGEVDDETSDPLMHTEIISLDDVVEPPAEPASKSSEPRLDEARVVSDDGASDAGDDILGLGEASPTADAPSQDDVVVDAASDESPEELFAGDAEVVEEDEPSIPLAVAEEKRSEAESIDVEPHEDAPSAVEAGLLPEPGEKNLDDELDDALSGESEPVSEDEAHALVVSDDEPEDEDPEIHTGLQGMDRGTAELLSSLEELESSLPTGSDATGGSSLGEVESSGDEPEVGAADLPSEESGDPSRPEADPPGDESGVAEFEDLEVDHEFAAREVEPEPVAAPSEEMLDEERSSSAGPDSAEVGQDDERDPAAPSMPSVEDVLGPSSSEIAPEEVAVSGAASDAGDPLSSENDDPMPSLELAATPGSEEDEAAERYAELLDRGPKSRASLWIAVLVLVVIAAGAAGGIWIYMQRDPGGAVTTGSASDDGAATEQSDASEIRWDAGAPPDTRAALRPVPRDSGSVEPTASTERPAPRAASESVVPAGRPEPVAARALTPERAGLGDTSGEIPEAELSSLDEPLRKIAGTVPAALRPEPGSSDAGRVFLNVLVGPDGTVLEAKVVVEPGSGAGAAVRDAVLDWRYSPPRRGRVPVKVWKTEAVSVKG